MIDPNSGCGHEQKINNTIMITINKEAFGPLSFLFDGIYAERGCDGLSSDNILT